MSTFPSIPTLIPEGRHGNVAVEHFTITRETGGVRWIIRPDEAIAEGTYARLLVQGRVMMSDTPMERRSNMGFVWKAHGHVLIGGLGLGMIVFPLLAKSAKEIKSVTVIEENAHVIALVAPHLPDDKRLRIIEADVFEWKPDRKFNTIYFDIWPDITTDNLNDMARLHRKYARALDRSDDLAWMGSWQHDLLKSRRRSEQREEQNYNLLRRAFR